MLLDDDEQLVEDNKEDYNNLLDEGVPSDNEDVVPNDNEGVVPNDNEGIVIMKVFYQVIMKVLFQVITNKMILMCTLDLVIMEMTGVVSKIIIMLMNWTIISSMMVFNKRIM